MFKHKHKWALSHTTWETVMSSNTGTTALQKEVGYLICQCGEIKKVDIKQPHLLTKEER